MSKESLDSSDGSSDEDEPSGQQEPQDKLLNRGRNYAGMRSQSTHLSEALGHSRSEDDNSDGTFSSDEGSSPRAKSSQDAGSPGRSLRREETGLSSIDDGDSNLSDDFSDDLGAKSSAEKNLATATSQSRSSPDSINAPAIGSRESPPKGNESPTLETPAAVKRESLMEDLRRASKDFKKIMADSESEGTLTPPDETQEKTPGDGKAKDTKTTRRVKGGAPKKKDNQLRSELQPMSMKELKAKAREIGFTEEDIEDAEEEDKPKQALIDMMIGGQEAEVVNHNPMLRRQAQEKERQDKETTVKAEKKAKLRAEIMSSTEFDGVPSGMDDRADARKQAKKEREARRAAKEKAKAKAKGKVKRQGTGDLKRQGTGDAIRKSIEEVRDAIKKVKEEDPPPPVIPGTGLLVTLIQAKGLRNTDAGTRGDKSDPYCTCEIPRKPKSKIETPVVWNNLNPVWNYTRQIVEYTENDMLKFCVWDKDYQTKQLLGKCDLKFEQYYPDGFEKWIPLPTTLKPAPELLVKVEVLGLPQALKSDKDPKVKKKKGPHIQYEFGRRVPFKGAPLSPRAQARFDAKRLVDSFDCWSQGLRGSDEFTNLIPSTVVRPPRPKKDAYGPPPEAEVALSTFKEFLVHRGGNYGRAWRIILDTDWHGKLTLIELGNKCREHGYHGNVRALWRAMDRMSRGWATVADIDAGTAELLARFYTALETRRRVEERGRRNAAHARGEAEEPESEPGNVGGNPDEGMKLMKCLDVDATRRLSKGEFCCAASVLQLCKEEEGPALFDMLCYATAAQTPNSAVVTEGELQWLHNVCEPFNLFEKPGKRGVEQPKKAPKVLSAHERLETRKQVLSTKGRLRKVWSQDPAVFGRLYDDFERREDVYFQRVTGEQDVGEVKTAEELAEVSNRLYEDAFTRNAKRDLESEGYEKPPTPPRPLDPEVLARLTAGKTEPKLKKRQKAIAEALQKAKEDAPKKKVDMTRINEMMKERSAWLEKREILKQDAKRRAVLADLELLKKPKETAAERARRNSLARHQIERLEAKLREQAEKEGVDIGEFGQMNAAEARERLQAIQKALRPGGKHVIGLGNLRDKEEAGHRQEDAIIEELLANFKPEAPIPIPRKSIEVSIVGPEGHYPHAKTPRWIAKNEISRARSAERANSPDAKLSPRSRPRSAVPAGPATLAAAMEEALPLEQHQDRRARRPAPVKVFPMPKSRSTPPLSVWSFSDGEAEEDALPDLGPSQDPLMQMQKLQAGTLGRGASASANFKAPQRRGEGAWDSPQRTFSPKERASHRDNTAVSRDELMSRASPSAATQHTAHAVYQPDVVAQPGADQQVEATAVPRDSPQATVAASPGTPASSDAEPGAPTVPVATASAVAGAAARAVSTPAVAVPAAAAPAAPAAAAAVPAVAVPEAAPAAAAEPAAAAAAASAAAAAAPAASTAAATAAAAVPAAAASARPTQSKNSIKSSSTPRGSVAQARAKTPPGGRRSQSSLTGRPSRDATPPAKRGSGGTNGGPGR